MFNFYLATLAFVYVVSAWLRFHAARVNRGIRYWYWASIPLWLLYAGGYVWAIKYGNSNARTLVLQYFALPFGVLVGIFPPLIGQQQGTQYRPTKLQKWWERRKGVE